MSIAILILAGLSLVRVLLSIFLTKYDPATLPAGVTEQTLFVTQIVLSVIALIFLLPQVYIGIKGMKMAANPDSSKGHIVWAAILLAIAVISLISPIKEMIQIGNYTSNIFYRYHLIA